MTGPPKGSIPVLGARVTLPPIRQDVGHQARVQKTWSANGSRAVLDTGHRSVNYLLTGEQEMRSWIKVMAYLGVIGVLAGCPQREKTLGDKVEDAAEDAGDAVEEAGEDLGEAID